MGSIEDAAPLTAAGQASADADVLILGGGFAGLAAASALAERGKRVTVLEKKPHLGGRACSFFDPRAGQTVDNGQHLFMGCYRHTRAFLRRIGSEDLLELSRSARVAYADSAGRQTLLSCPSWLGSPYHLLAGVLGLGGLTWAEKWAMRRLGAWFKSSGLNGNAAALDAVTVSQWLTELGQPERLKERFYYPIALGALNEDPRRASALGFVQVLREIFFSDAEALRLGLSKVGLSELYAGQAARLIADRGGSVLTSQRVTGIAAEGAGLRVLRERGEPISARSVVSTLAPWDLAKLSLPEALGPRPWTALKPSPIVSVNVWLDRPVLSEPLVGLLGTDVQWAFNRSRLWGLSGPGQALALVFSGAHREAALSPAEIFESARRGLELCFPQAKKAKITRWTAVKEPFATISPEPGSDALRPGHRTPVSGFFLAGDWTQTGLPATIESAVKSGHAAADLIGGV